MFLILWSNSSPQGCLKKRIVKSRRLFTLSTGQRARLVKAYWLLFRAHLFHDIRRDMCLNPTDRGPRPDRELILIPKDRKAIRERVRLIDIASRHPFQWARCLQRSQALIWWLQGEGVDAKLRIGVTKDGSKLSAHAWVEYGGQVLNDHQDTSKHYSPLQQARDTRTGGSST